MKAKYLVPKIEAQEIESDSQLCAGSGVSSGGSGGGPDNGGTTTGEDDSDAKGGLSIWTE